METASEVGVTILIRKSLKQDDRNPFVLPGILKERVLVEGAQGLLFLQKALEVWKILRTLTHLARSTRFPDLRIHV